MSRDEAAPTPAPELDPPAAAGPSIREALEQSFDTAESGESGELDTGGPATAEATPADPALVPGSGEEPTTGAAPADPLAPPQHWKPEDREAFAKLPAEAKSVVLAQSKRMEAAHTARTQELAAQQEIAARYQELDQLFTPMRDQLRLAGMTETQLVSQLLAARNVLAQSPVEGLKWLAGQYGIDLGQLVDQYQDPDHQQPDPQFTQVADRLGAIEQQILAQGQANAQAVNGRVLNEIDAFANSNPYVAELMTDMVALATADRVSGKAPQLADLYERAKWSNPEVRAKLQQDQALAAEAERKKAAANARKLRTTVSASDPSGGAVSNDAGSRQSLRQTLEHAFEEAETNV